MANSRFPIISVQGSYFGVNYGDILLIRLYSKWISEAYGDKVLINYPLADQNGYAPFFQAFLAAITPLLTNGFGRLNWVDMLRFFQSAAGIV